MQEQLINNNQNEWQATILEQGLNQLGQAMIIVSCRAEVVYISKAAEQIISARRGLSIKSKHIVADRAQDNLRLQEAVQALIKETDVETPCNFNIYIHKDDFMRPLHLNINKMPKNDQERREGHYALMLIKDLNLNQEYWLDRLKLEYGLAPRETQCVALLAEGRDVSDVAEVMEIGKETVRQYMKNVYKKMKVHRQHELVSLALEYRRNR